MATLFMTGTAELIPVSGSLKAIGFKPWWETIQSYCIYALLAIDVMIFYINASFSTVTCTPSAKDAPSMTTPDANFVNSFCYSEIDETFRHSGRNILIGCVGLYLLNAWWELVPVVTTRFLTVKTVDNLLHLRHLPKSEMERIVTTPLQNHMEHDGTASAGDSEGRRDSRVARDACRRLFFRRDGFFTLFTIYLVRNILGVGGVSPFLWLSWTSYHKSVNQSQPTFECALDNQTAAVLGVTEFRCSNHLPNQLAGYFLALFVILLVVSLMILIGALLSLINNCCCSDTHAEASKKGKDLMKDYAFVTLFSQHSTKVHGSTKVAMSLISEDSLEAMENHIQEAIKQRDKDFLRLFCRVRLNGKKTITEKSKSMLDGSDEELVAAARYMRENFPDLFTENTRNSGGVTGARNREQTNEPSQIRTGNQGSSPGGSPEHTQSVAPGARRKDRSSRGRPNGNRGPADLPHGGHSPTTPLLQDDGSTYREEEELQNTAKNNRSKRQDPNLAGKTTSNQGPIVNITADRINQVNTGQTGGSSHYHDYDDSGAGGDSLGPQTHET